MKITALSVYCFVAALFATLAAAHRHSNYNKHSCSHDSDEKIQQFYKEYADEILKNTDKRRFLDDETPERKLASSTTQPFRVTIDTTPLNSGLTAAQKTYLTSITVTVQNFLKYFIKVLQVSGNNIAPSSLTTCIDTAVPAADRSTGIANSDLHLYIIWTNDSGSSYLANAGWCNIYQSSTVIRPNFGRVNYNIGTMTMTAGDLNLYNYNLMVTLHEVIHVLGFSGGSMEYWVDRSSMAFIGTSGVSSITSSQTIRSLSTTLLSSANVLKTAKQYYGCTSMTGMQIENQGGSGSLGSHWERVVIQDEVMTASAVIEGSILSVFTAALLRDTGYWDEVNDNLTSPIWWGKNESCTFLTYDCTTSTAYPEFTTSGTTGCTFWQDGYGQASSETFSDGCAYIRAYSNVLCEDSDVASDSYNSNASSYLESFGYNSKCFPSTIMNPSAGFTSSKAIRCLKYSCSSDQTVITVTSPSLSSFSFDCTSADAGVQKTVTYSGSSIGTITCPTNYNRFCDNQTCPNFCSLNGVCVRGNCFCNPGTSGEDCSLTCSTYSEGGSCVSSCSTNKYANPDNTCKSTCPIGFYGSSGVCVQCDYSCSKCTGSTSSDCTACQAFTYLSTSTCVETCPTGSYADSTTRVCEDCPTGCADCTSSTVCGSCESGFVLTGTLCTGATCDANCVTCTSTSTECLSCSSANSLYLNSSTSTCVVASSCPSGTFANSTNQKCSACSTGCTTCSSATVCTVCNTGSGYRLSGSSCTLCATDCATCESSDTTKCLTCENSKYVQNYVCYTTCPSTYYNGSNYQCASCVTGCDVCSNGTSCTTCLTASGYQSYTYNSANVCITSSSCFSPCATCSTAFSPEVCSTCDSSYVLQGTSCKSSCDAGYYADSSNVCQQCDTSCKTCSGSNTTCTSCDTTYLYSGTCVATCPTDYSTSGQVCVSNSNGSLFGSQSRLIFSIILALFAFLL